MSQSETLTDTLDHVNLVIKPHRYARDTEYRNRFQHNPAFQELVAVLAGEVLAAYNTQQIQQHPAPADHLVALLRKHGLPPRGAPAIEQAHDTD